jgi:putative PIN family toxin of toxin-antitoxin system
MLRIVLDTDVVVAGFLSPDGASRQLLLDALDAKFTLLASTTLLSEYESVLRREEHQKKARTTEAGVTEILDGLADVCQKVEFDFPGSQPAPMPMTNSLSVPRSMEMQTRW